MIIYLNLDEKIKCRKKREKGEILFHLGSNIVVIFENLLTGVVAALECCDRRCPCFLGKKSDLKMKS